MPPYNRFIYAVLGEKSTSAMMDVSVYFMMMSCVLTIVKCVPPLYKNCRERSTRSIDPRMVALWVAADALCLVSCLVKRSNMAMTALAVILVVQDCLLGAQLAYFTYVRRPPGASKAKSTRLSLKGALRPVALLSCVLVTAGSPLYASFSCSPSSSPSRALLSADAVTVATWRLTLGTILMAVSAALSISSRLPTLVTNFKTRVAPPVSFLMYVLLVLTNACFAVHVLLKSLCDGWTSHDVPAYCVSFGNCTTSFLDACCATDASQDAVSSTQSSCFSWQRTAKLLHVTSRMGGQPSIGRLVGRRCHPVRPWPGLLGARLRLHYDHKHYTVVSGKYMSYCGSQRGSRQ